MVKIQTALFFISVLQNAKAAYTVNLAEFKCAVPDSETSFVCPNNAEGADCVVNVYKSKNGKLSVTKSASVGADGSGGKEVETSNGTITAEGSASGSASYESTEEKESQTVIEQNLAVKSGTIMCAIYGARHDETCSLLISSQQALNTTPVTCFHTACEKDLK